MNKQEVINKLQSSLYPETSISSWDEGYNTGITQAIHTVTELDELDKEVVPQFVADWYEENKDYFEYNLHSLCVDSHEQKSQGGLYAWLNKLSNKPIETLVKMKLFGYEVEKEKEKEKEKLYTVEIPICNSPLGYHYVLRKTTSGEIIIDSFFTNNWRNYDYCQITEEEIKKDHDWAWKYAEGVEE